MEDVDSLYEKLKTLTNVDEAVKTAHVADIERKYKKPKEQTPVNQADYDTSVQKDADVIKAEDAHLGVSETVEDTVLAALLSASRRPHHWPRQNRPAL